MWFNERCVVSISQHSCNRIYLICSCINYYESPVSQSYDSDLPPVSSSFNLFLFPNGSLNSFALNFQFCLTGSHGNRNNNNKIKNNRLFYLTPSPKAFCFIVHANHNNNIFKWEIRLLYKMLRLFFVVFYFNSNEFFYGILNGITIISACVCDHLYFAANHLWVI